MARSPLFSALRRVARNAALQRTTARTPTVAAHPPSPRRRTVLQAAGLAVPGAMLAGCGDDASMPPSTSDESVAIIGGGIAGLHCAYRLREAGITATVYEARDRVGGRMFTAREAFSEAPDQICELGGEFIDTGHETLRALAEELAIELDDRLTDEDPGFKRDTWYVGGVEVPEETVVEQFVAVAPSIAADFEAAETDDDAYASLDETSLDTYLIDKVPPAQYPELHAILQNAYRGEYGRETEQQSALNLIYLIGFDEPDPFRIFGISDERYHTHLGNDTFASSIAAALAPEQIKLEHALTLARDTTTGFELVFDTPEGKVSASATRIVFALPFTTLREIDLAALSLSERKRTIIDSLGYGTNAKIMIGFEDKTWRNQYSSSGSLVTDLPVQQSWETTVGQAGAHGILTNFLGGQAGVDAGAGEAADRAEAVLPDLETVWPGIAAAFTGEAVRMHWPTVPTMKGSYACYSPGQWDFYGDEGVREGNIYFCGEHTSLDFQGYMEGGAETGALVAAEIIDDLALNQPQGLRDVLGVKLGIPQACFGAWRWGRLNPLARRRIIAQLYRAPNAR